MMSLILLLLYVSYCRGQPRPCNIKPHISCSCWEEYGQAVTCNYGNLESIPHLLANGNQHTLVVDTLELAHHKIDNIEPDNFKNTLVRRLVLSHNNIKIINDGAFEGMATELETLDLSHNRLENFTYQWPSNAVLKTINLEDNQISDLSATLQSLPNSVRHLQLVNNQLDTFVLDAQSNVNNLESITFGPVSAFKISDMFTTENHKLRKLEIVDTAIDMSTKSINSLRKLRRLNELDLKHCTLTPSFAWQASSTFEPVRNSLKLISLPYNNLGEVPLSIYHLTKLYSLNLSHNEIETIFADDFRNNPKLQYIYLKHNKISAISKEAFSSLKRLKVLDLTHNQLDQLHEAAFDASLFPFISVLVGHNPWNCTCDISWMISSVRRELHGKPGPFRTNEIHSQDTVTCKVPSEYEGQSFYQLAKFGYEEFSSKCKRVR